MSTDNKSKLWSDIRSKYSIYFVLTALFIISWMANENFVSAENLKNISAQISVGTILAFGQTVLIISGMLDLYSGSVLALAGVLSISSYKMTGSLLIAFIVAIVVGVVCNILNGIMITKFKTPPFIATLAMMTMAGSSSCILTAKISIR